MVSTAQFRRPQGSCTFGKEIEVEVESTPQVRNRQGFEHFAARAIAEIAFASVGTVLLACAFIANQRFLDRHFLPSFLFPRHWYVVLETLGRLALFILGALLVFVARPRAARFAARTPARALHIVVAVVLALGTSELVLQSCARRPGRVAIVQ